MNLQAGGGKEYDDQGTEGWHGYRWAFG